MQLPFGLGIETGWGSSQKSVGTVAAAPQETEGFGTAEAGPATGNADLEAGGERGHTDDEAKCLGLEPSEMEGRAFVEKSLDFSLLEECLLFKLKDKHKQTGGNVGAMEELENAFGLAEESCPGISDKLIAHMVERVQR
ncbi:hypothetical protein JD844_007204 [Phrynosoma platyrhinos]|uniref:Uncharacterized protein n=1 Tax=Phrynosoma platyrhinos TaxID=52577 RepID=A0ABQ7T2V0_PHRPL|nr:hypothetical protein JD844_007204 [Phrynosoma platyrhinos]